MREIQNSKMRERDLAATQFIIMRLIAYGPFSNHKAAMDWADDHFPGEEHAIHALHDPAKVSRSTD